MVSEILSSHQKYSHSILNILNFDLLRIVFFHVVVVVTRSTFVYNLHRKKKW